MKRIVLPDGPLALSLSGGGSKGAYQVGVLRFVATVLKRTDFKVIYGTSTGALVASLFSLYCITKDFKYIQDLTNLYTEVLQGDVLQPKYQLAEQIIGTTGGVAAAAITGGDSVYTTEPLAKLIDRFIGDKECELLLEAGKTGELDTGFAYTSLQSGKGVVASTTTIPDCDTLKKTLLASASQPVFMNPVRMNGEERVDGGLRIYNPVEQIFESVNADKVAAILSVELDGSNNQSTAKYESITDILMRTIDILLNEVQQQDSVASNLWNILLKSKEIMTNAQWKNLVGSLPNQVRYDLQRRIKAKRFIPIHLVQPKKPIALNALEFRQPQMKRLVKRGFKEATQQLQIPS